MVCMRLGGVVGDKHIGDFPEFYGAKGTGYFNFHRLNIAGVGKSGGNHKGSSQKFGIQVARRAPRQLVPYRAHELRGGEIELFHFIGVKLDGEGGIEHTLDFHIGQTGDTQEVGFDGGAGILQQLPPGKRAAERINDEGLLIFQLLGHPA